MRIVDVPRPAINQLERLERLGDKLSVPTEQDLERALERAEVVPPFPAHLEQLLTLKGNEKVAWDACFGFWDALAAGQRLHVLDFAEGIIDARDKLLEFRRKLEPIGEMDLIAEIDKLLGEAVYRVETIRRLFDRGDE